MTGISISMSAAASAAFVLAPGWAWAQGPSDSARYADAPHMLGWGGGWPGMLFGPLFIILVLAATIVLAVVLARWLGGSSPSAARRQERPPRAALDTLKERYARGEIDREEFEERRRILGE